MLTQLFFTPVFDQKCVNFGTRRMIAFKRKHIGMCGVKTGGVNIIACQCRLMIQNAKAGGVASRMRVK